MWYQTQNRAEIVDGERSYWVESSYVGRSCRAIYVMLNGSRMITKAEYDIGVRDNLPVAQVVPHHQPKS